MICLLFLWDLWFELANACPPVTNNDWKRKLEWFSLCLHNNPQRTLLWLNICVWGLSPPFPADRQFSSKFSSKQTPIIGATHNPTNVLEFLHNQPAWLFDLVDECSMDNTTYVKEEDYYCLPFDVDSTFSQSFGTKGFSIQDSILLFFPQLILEISSFLKFLSSSEPHCFVEFLSKGQSKCQVSCVSVHLSECLTRAL